MIGKAAFQVPGQSTAPWISDTSAAAAEQEEQSLLYVTKWGHEIYTPTSATETLPDPPQDLTYGSLHRRKLQLQN